MNLRVLIPVSAMLCSALVSAQVEKGPGDIAPVQTIEVKGDPDRVPPPAPEPDSNAVYTVVERMPEFPGGSGAMMLYLSKHIEYPDEALDAGMAGKVFLRFVVDKEGQVKDVKVLRGVAGAPSLEREAVRVVKGMPKWSPGVQNGKAVATQYTLPVYFKMTGKGKRK